MMHKSKISLVRSLIQEIIDEEVDMILESFELLPEQPASPPPPTDAPEPALDAPGDDSGGDADLGDLDLGDDSGDGLEGSGDDLGGDSGDAAGLDGGEGGEDEMPDLGGGGGMPSFGGGGGGGGLDMGGDDTGDESGDDSGGGEADESGPKKTGDPVEDTFSVAEEVAKNTQNPQKVLNSIKAAIQDSTIRSKGDMSKLIDKMSSDENPVLKDASRRLRIFIST